MTQCPAVLSLGKVQRELSWHGLLQHLRGQASAAEAEAQLQADVAMLAASWTTIRRCLQRRGIRYPRTRDDGGESTPPPGAVACANYHPTESRLAGTAADIWEFAPQSYPIVS